jgi:hypothetical protein
LPTKLTTPRLANKKSSTKYQLGQRRSRCYNEGKQDFLAALFSKINKSRKSNSNTKKIKMPNKYSCF